MIHKRILILLIILTSLYSINILGTEYQTLKSGDNVFVLDVIDANALLVRTSDNKQALIRVLGIDASKTDEAKNYVENLIENKYIVVKSDSVYPSEKGRWNYMHVYFNDTINGRVSLGETLLSTGLGVIDKNTLTNDINNNYTNKEEIAKDNNYGVWFDDNNYYNSFKSEHAININTATKSDITSMLKAVFDDDDYDDYTYVANSIINYRDDNIFTTIDELKFVNDMTKDDYDELRNYFTITTNIRTANMRELESLIDITNSRANKIQDYISKHSNTTFEELYEEDVITKNQYIKNKPYISTTPENEKLLPEPNYVVNVNTASTKQLKNAGVSNTIAKQIVEEREDSNFTFKNVTEIYEHSKISMNKSHINKYEDNLTFFTNINNATRIELESLFGDDYNKAVIDLLYNKEINSLEELRVMIPVDDYNQICNYIKFDDSNIEYFNINTVSKEYLRNLKVDEDAIDWIMRRQGNIDDMNDLNDVVSKYDKMFTLYTNINKATVKEIMTLDEDIPTSMASTIVRIASNEMYAEIEEIEDIFIDNDLKSEFRNIDEFIVFR